ncbi:hypothetical protein IAQ61_011667 [Plenodomus lingam]|uniref:uncharacterized protein n=1 Tax=Leptosphaeria maculans TaxID=5022 RepID=UPI0033280268|nr:hypothetical protein IAQ61_011667 [Plenodomus lingam]
MATGNKPWFALHSHSVGLGCTWATASTPLPPSSHHNRLSASACRCSLSKQAHITHPYLRRRLLLHAKSPTQSIFPTITTLLSCQQPTT